MIRIFDSAVLGGRVVGFADTSSFTGKIHVGDVLVDSRGERYVLSGVGHVRYATVEDAERNRGMTPVVLRKQSGEPESPVGDMVQVAGGSC